MSKKRTQAPQLRIPSLTPQAPVTHGPQKVTSQVSFDQWWNRISVTRKLKPALKQAVKLHLQARGFMKSGQYDAGLKDFGL